MRTALNCLEDPLSLSCLVRRRSTSTLGTSLRNSSSYLECDGQNVSNSSPLRPSLASAIHAIELAISIVNRFDFTCGLFSFGLAVERRTMKLFTCSRDSTPLVRD